MAQAPRRDVQEAFVAPTSQVIRRVEIYEQDGTTPWKQELWDELLLAGTIGLDYDRDERRSLDLDLDNYTGDLSPEAGGFWYDKRIKVFYGIQLDQDDRGVRVAIVEDFQSPNQAFALRNHLSSAGINEVHYLPSTISAAQVADYDVIVSISATTTQKYQLLVDCYNGGKGVVTFSRTSTAAQLPLVIGNAAANTSSYPSERTYAPTGGDSAVTVGWDEWGVTEGTEYRQILAPATGAYTQATVAGDATSVAVITRQGANGRWVHVNQARFDSTVITRNFEEFSKFAESMVVWANNFVPLEFWEIQLGEFMMDSITLGDDYSAIKVNGRDLTKMCIQSKLPASTSFAKSRPIEDIVKIMATNAGITRMKLPITNKTLDKDTTWERDTTRWEVIKTVCNSNNYEVYFDNEGYLVMREYLDPLLSTPSLTLTTGEGGNLVSRGAKTTDARIFNHIVVVGESSSTDTPPVFAEAINNVSGSPTSVDEIGDRVQVTTSALITTQPQAQELANSLLAVSALEEFELPFEATLLPWIEVGEILLMSEGQERYWGPDRFLLTSLSFPLDLSPMSGTGKRVEKVVTPDV